jgi:fructokinase
MSFKLVGIGEVLWDLLPSGPKLGGAPANFGYHAHALGAEAFVVTRVGTDDFGQKILRQFEEQQIANGTVQVDDEVPTGMVTVTLSEHGIPSYNIQENVAWDRIAVTPTALRAVHQADAVCFGSLAQRCETSRASIQRLLAAAPAESLRVFDINLRQKYYSRELIEQSLRLANVLKLNDGELPVVANFFGLSGSTRDQIENLANQFDLHLIALTRGADGSLLYRRGQWSDCPSVPTEVIDTVGAGDAFTATLVMGLLQKMKLDEINYLADEIARHVCSSAGATPNLPAKLIERFAARDLSPKTKPMVQTETKLT